ncbi:DUF6384 family protein [Massilia sp. BJB1822]|uniref:DUF6384 family protein n=1 Tax=Massilia sp. BJB1822 TaxID=2744470 RepID=UPI001594AAC5|nr:DUF6384 family protein [Massilia sp. BJB1822]NVE00781.1 hypothetical protein [Massilia sp. BJB1822]
MTSLGLSQQLEVIGLIDEIRHRKMLEEDLLDLPAQRRVVAQRIREYYQTQNVKVDDALIEQGVRAYFERRLEFSVVQRSRLSDVMCRAYVAVSRGMGWTRVLLLLLALFASLAVAVSLWKAALQKGEAVRSHVLLNKEP